MNNFLLKAAESHLDSSTVDKIYLAAALVSSAHKRKAQTLKPQRSSQTNLPTVAEDYGAARASPREPS